MLKVKTYLEVSPVHGIGVYAGENIPYGTIVWEFNPYVDLVYTPEQWSAIEAGVSCQSMEVMRRYSYKEKGRYYLCLDNAQFMNHSQDNYNLINNKKNNTMHAEKDISKGDELLCNYYEYSDSDDIHLQCLNREKNNN